MDHILTHFQNCQESSPKEFPKEQKEPFLKKIDHQKPPESSSCQSYVPPVVIGFSIPETKETFTKN